ncbi:MAG TPA: branched-chain amino acid ABC transporter permease [Oligoflexia bacterium]|nr:branched-chain amino acid ABC transporter permease [Oligoflexia bacterium]HMP48444.1 branched-chain amino acid ABC transporter permease [Oligoflexia bacterium]
MDYIIHLIILVGLYLILAQSYNLTFGLGRLLNLAHIASYAIGAYATAILITDYSMSFFLALVSGMLLSTLFALIIGAVSLRLDDDYFAIGTLSFSFVISAILINFKSLTRGVLGIPGIPRPEFDSGGVADNSQFLGFVILLVFFTLSIIWFLFQSRLGRSLRMQSEHVPATQALGVSIYNTRSFSFAVSSAFAAMAGSLFAVYITYVDPSSFALHEMVFVLSIIIIGQPGSFWGVIASTIFLVLLPEPLRFIEISPSILGPMRQLLYSSILFVTVLIRREQIFPLKRMV